MRKYELLAGSTFDESYLVDIQFDPWPHNVVFVIWSTVDSLCYRLIARIVVEFHYAHTFTGPFGYDYVLLGSVSIARGNDYRYWAERVRTFVSDGTGASGDPVCLVFDSYVFASRIRESRVSAKDVGMLVVCRDFDIEVDYRYEGPRPYPHNIPSGDE